MGFLAGQQRASGRFLSFVGGGRAVRNPRDDQSVFATALIVRALTACDAPLARAAAARAADFLERHAEPPGVWRFWTPSHPSFHAIPADADDTACASIALRACGRPVPDNARALLASRDARGLFHTWLVARWPPPPAASGLWPVLARRARHPVQARRFWGGGATARPGDVDAVVNANVLLHLGDGPYAAAVADHLLSVLERGEERRADRWYYSPLMLHDAVARCVAAGVGALTPARDLIVRRVAEATRADGRIGAGPQDTALGVSALWHCGADAELRARSAAHLEAQQTADGSWPGEALHGADEQSWGSPALTTALCAEALARHGAGPG